MWNRIRKYYSIFINFLLIYSYSVKISTNKKKNHSRTCNYYSRATMQQWAIKWIYTAWRQGCPFQPNTLLLPRGEVSKLCSWHTTHYNGMLSHLLGKCCDLFPLCVKGHRCEFRVEPGPNLRVMCSSKLPLPLWDGVAGWTDVPPAKSRGGTERLRSYNRYKVYTRTNAYCNLYVALPILPKPLGNKSLVKICKNMYQEIIKY